MGKKEKRAVLFAALAGCMWGSIGLFVHKLGRYGIDSVTLTVGRFLLASVLAGLFLALWKRERLKIRPFDLLWFFVTGVLCLLFFNVSYGIAIEKSSMSVAAVLLYTSPAVVTFVSVAVFCEKLTAYKITAVLLAITGCAFVSGIMSGFPAYPAQAYLWGFGAAVGYAFYSIVGGILLKRYHPITVLFYSFLTASIGGCFLIDLPEVAKTVVQSPAAGFWLAGSAVVCNICSYLCYNLALENMEASRVSVVASIEPAVASLLGVMVMKEPVDFFGVAGVGCIFGAIAVLNCEKKGGENMSGKHLAVIRALMQQPEWRTAKQLASQLHVSNRSVINYIGEINYQEEGLIEASKSGYRIDKEKAKKILEKQAGSLPETSAERINYIITELLSSESMQEEGIDLYEISERIFVSYETLRKDLAKVRKKVKEYGLFANVYGSCVKLEGKELNKRKLLSAILYEEFNQHIVSLDLVQKVFPDYDLEVLRDLVLTECRKYHYYINDFAILNLILEIAISMERIQKNCTFRTHTAESRTFEKQELELVRSIAERVEDTFSVCISGLELQELTPLILSHLMKMDVNEQNQESVRKFVPPESMAVVERVLDYLNENYYIDTSDQEFLVKFSIHINNLLLRLENHYTAKNPLTDHIKKTCPLIFECAVGVANCLNQMTGFRIDEDEIAYIAIHIGGNLENNEKRKDKLSCVLLFPQYYDMSDIMEERINKEFFNSLVIQNVITRASELSKMKKADILISTIDVHEQEWEHVVIVNPFLRADDLEKIHETIFEIKKEKKKKHLRETLLQMTSPELFRINKTNWSQNQALEVMVREMERQGYVNSDFIGEVKKREEHSTTAFGRLAVPHALELNAYKTGIYILNSEKPIKWGSDPVNLVLLFAINRDDRMLFHEVFDNLVVLLLEKQNLDRVLASKNYDEFVNTILTCE